jgi:lipoate-protein ligase A
MQLVINKKNDPAWNLAFEEYLFSLAEQRRENYVMFWKNGPSIIIGRFQNTAQEVNIEAVNQAGVKVVRRNTGGGAVYHDLGNLNYSFIVSGENLGQFDFKIMAKPILSCLQRLGVPAEFAGRNDLVVEGQKFSGTAQQAKKNSLLYHGTLLYDTDLSRLSQMLNVSPHKYESKGVKSVRSRVTNLKQYLPKDFTLDALERELVKEMGAEVKELSKEDLADIAQRQETKYDTWEWNWGKSPEFSVKKEKKFLWGHICLAFEVVDGIIVFMRVFGDFFSKDLGSLESSLIGLNYESKEVSKILLNLSNLVVGANNQDILELIAG